MFQVIITKNHLSIKLLRDDPKLREHYANIDQKGHAGDSGINLAFPEDLEISPRKVTFIKLGVAAAMTKIGKPSSYFLMPRSSIAKTPLILANSVGLIDAGYRGELIAAVRNLSDVPFFIQKGTSLFQVVAPNAKPIKVSIVDELSMTSRGSGGFGSTNC